MKFTETYTSITNTHVKFDLFLPSIAIRYKAILQIHHGMGEHKDRYEKLASFLAHYGYVVVVADFPGHGTSLHRFEQGFFGEGNPLDTLVSDIHRLRDIIARRYADLPYFMIGNQMGSLVVRKYMSQFGEYINGAVLMGTIEELPFTKMMKFRIHRDFKFRGMLHRNQKLAEHLRKAFNKGYDHPYDYMTTDQREIHEYVEDPFTDFAYTASGYLGMLEYQKYVNSIKAMDTVPTDLSILILSGKEDTLGHNGKDATNLYNRFKQHGIEDVDLKLYEGFRHDILHEIRHEDVFRDIMYWLDERTFG